MDYDPSGEEWQLFTAVEKETVMLLKSIKESTRKSEGVFQKIAHGLVGNVFNDEGCDCSIDLRDTRAVGIRIARLNKSFGDNHVLKDVDLEIRAGETFSIIGPSGTGKSVLLKLIVKLDVPDSGEIFIDEIPVFGGSVKTEERDYRYSMVFQSSALFNSLTVGENVGLWLGRNGFARKTELGRLFVKTRLGRPQGEGKAAYRRTVRRNEEEGGHRSISGHESGSDPL